MFRVSLFVLRGKDIELLPLKHSALLMGIYENTDFIRCESEKSHIFRRLGYCQEFILMHVD